MSNADDLCDKGRKIFYDPALLSMDGNNQARVYLEDAIKIDPDHALAHAGLAYVYLRDWENDWGSLSAPASLAKALQTALRAVQLGPYHSDCHWNLAIVYSNMGMFAEAMTGYGISTMLNPINHNMLAEMGDSLVQQGRHKDAITQIGKAIADQKALGQAVPYTHHWSLIRALYMDKQISQALALFNSDLLPTVNFLPSLPADIYLLLAALLVRDGQNASGEAEMKKFLAKEATWTVKDSARYPWVNVADRDWWLDALILAKMP